MDVDPRRHHADAEVEDFAFVAMSKLVAMRRGTESMDGFDQVLIDSGYDPADFLKALHSEIAAGFKLTTPPGSVHTFKGLIMPGVVRAGLVSDRVRGRYEASGIKLFSDTQILEHFERTGDVAASS